MASWGFITYYCVFSMLILAYILGSIPSAVWIGKKYYGVDIREHGSKNAGTTNMLRVLGKRAAIPVFVLDFFKGFAAVSLFSIMRYDPDISSAWLINLKILGVFAAVLGHIFPIFADFKGGKGVATLVGAVTGIYPQIILLCFDRTPQAGTAYVKKYGVKFPAVMADFQAIGAIGLPGFTPPRGIPHVTFVSPEGKVLHAGFGGTMLGWRDIIAK